jgi:hypothetical protein
MDTKKILLEEINRIKYISSYDSRETSEENRINILERGGEGREVWRGFQELLRTDREAFSAFKSELEGIMKTLKVVTEDGKQLKNADDVLRAIRDGKIALESMVDIGAMTFKQTQNVKLMEALAEDIVRSEKFISDYRNLSNDKILSKLADGKMKIPKNSKQAEAILKANERALAQDAKTGFDEFRSGYREFEGGFGGFRDSERAYGNFRSEREYEEAAKRWYQKNRDIDRAIQGKQTKTVFDRLKSSGLLIWKGGKWIIGNALWILLFGGLAYGVWQYFSKETGVEREGEEGTSDDYQRPEPKITDSQGNVYNPCTGIYKIGCVTSDSDGGIDYISKAQQCLGLSVTGMFNKELENRLASKINQRTFTKDDMKYICMAGGTLARL